MSIFEQPILNHIMMAMIIIIKIQVVADIKPWRKRIHTIQEPYTTLLQYNPVSKQMSISMMTWEEELHWRWVFQGKKILTVQNIAVGVSLKATLARPKSQIFSLQSAFAKIFFGFRSRWKTFATIHKKV